MVAVDLVGPTPLWRELRDPDEVAQVAGELATRLGALEVEIRTNRIHPRAEVENHIDRQDVLGATLRLAREIRRGNETLEIDPEALAGFDAERQGSLNQYIRELLEGAPEEVLAQMLQQNGDAE